MFNSLVANKSSSKHSSDQNAEEGRRCVSTHCSLTWVCTITSTDMITGKGLDSHMSVFRPQHRGTRYLLVLTKDSTHPRPISAAFSDTPSEHVQRTGEGYVFMYQHSPLFSFRKAPGCVIYFR